MEHEDAKGTILSQHIWGLKRARTSLPASRQGGTATTPTTSSAVCTCPRSGISSSSRRSPDPISFKVMSHTVISSCAQFNFFHNCNCINYNYISIVSGHFYYDKTWPVEISNVTLLRLPLLYFPFMHTIAFNAINLALLHEVLLY